MDVEARPHDDLFFQKSIFLIKIHVRQYLNKMGEFLKVMELKYSFSRQLTDSKANIMNILQEPEMVQLVWTDKWLTTSSTLPNKVYEITRS